MQTQLMKKKLKKYNKIISKFNKENKNICDDELLRENHVCTWVCWCETLMNKKIVKLKPLSKKTIKEIDKIICDVVSRALNKND